MASSQLKELAETIRKKSVIAKQDPGFDPSSRRVKLGKINRAKEDVKELTEQYRNELRMKTAFILVTGSSCKKFSETAVKSFNCFSVNANDFYEDICSMVDKRLYTDYTSSPNIFNLIGARIEEVAKEIGIDGYPPLLFESKYKKVLKGKKDLVNLTKRAFNDKVGAEMIGLYAVDKVVPQAVEKEFGSKIVPIILVCEDEELVSDFLRDFPLVFGNTFVVGVGDLQEETEKLALTTVKTGNKKQVEESLSLVRKKLK